VLTLALALALAAMGLVQAEPTPDAIAELYRSSCAPCHGERGDGKGPAAALLDPAPRDFTRGEYRIVSTWDGVPTESDVAETIARGMPGSAMPPWGHLDRTVIDALARRIMAFSRRPLTVEPNAEPELPGESGRGVLLIPPRPADSGADGRARGAKLYAEGCAPCHGATGRGDGKLQQHDSAGRPTVPRDLTRGLLKGPTDAESVYRRIVLGLPGSPMPQSAYLHGDDGWWLTDHVLSLSTPEQREEQALRRQSLAPGRAARLRFMPLRWTRETEARVATVETTRDGAKLGVRVTVEGAPGGSELLLWTGHGPNPPLPGLGEDPHTGVVASATLTRSGARLAVALDAGDALLALGLLEPAGRSITVWHELGTAP